MGVINRDYDPSEKRRDFTVCIEPANTGSTLPVLVVPWPSTLDQIVTSSIGLSGAPTLTATVSRFIPGTGATVISSFGAALTVSEQGTSGPVGFSLIAQSATNASLLILSAGDVLSLTVGGSNAAIAALSVNVCLKALQDIKSHYGLSGMIGTFAG